MGCKSYEITILNKRYNVNLKELNLENNKLQNSAAEISNLINLQELKLSYNKFQSLPAIIGNLHNLEYLEIIILKKITNLPISLKILIKPNTESLIEKLPFNCILKKYKYIYTINATYKLIFLLI